MLRLAAGLERLPDEWARATEPTWSQRSNPMAALPAAKAPAICTTRPSPCAAWHSWACSRATWPRSAGSYLQSQLTERVPVVDFLSLIYSAAMLRIAAGIDVFAAQGDHWRLRVGDAVAALRRDDGGYAKTDVGQASSVYQSFLVVLCQQLIEQPTPESGRLVQFVRARRREDGGFVEMNVMKRSGTNPTAAALGLLRIFDVIDDEIGTSAADFLCGMQTDEGGLRQLANSHRRSAEHVYRAADAGRSGRGWTTPICRLRGSYVDSLQLSDGGFHGAAWDAGRDVEYTFYGLGATALLAPPHR